MNNKKCRKSSKDEANARKHGDAPVAPRLIGERIGAAAAMEVFATLDTATQDILKRAVRDARSPEEFVAAVMVGPCPKCGSARTADCEDVEAINDICVSSCSDCGQHWCAECGALFKEGQMGCDHWAICEECEQAKNADGVCGVAEVDCMRLAKRRG